MIVDYGMEKCQFSFKDVSHIILPGVKDESG